MAAQFSAAAIPAAHNAELKIELENGLYKVTVRQFFDPDNCLEHFDTESKEDVSFVIVITPAIEFIRQHANIVHWYNI